MADTHPWRRHISWSQIRKLKKKEQNKRRYNGRISPGTREAKFKEVA